MNEAKSKMATRSRRYEQRKRDSSLRRLGVWSRNSIRDAECANDCGCDVVGEFACGFFNEFVDEGLVGFGLLGGPAAEQRDVSQLRRLAIHIPSTQRFRAGLASGAPTALQGQDKDQEAGLKSGFYVGEEQEHRSEDRPLQLKRPASEGGRYNDRREGAIYRAPTRRKEKSTARNGCATRTNRCRQGCRRYAGRPNTKMSG